MSALGDLPLLQDTKTENVWSSWGVTFRDVVILDEANECYAIYNLTTNNLSDSDNAAELEALFESAIRGDASPSPCP